MTILQSLLLFHHSIIMHFQAWFSRKRFVETLFYYNIVMITFSIRLRFDSQHRQGFVSPIVQKFMFIYFNALHLNTIWEIIMKFNINMFILLYFVYYACFCILPLDVAAARRCYTIHCPDNIYDFTFYFCILKRYYNNNDTVYAITETGFDSQQGHAFVW